MVDGVFLVSQGPKPCLHQDCSRMPNTILRAEDISVLMSVCACACKFVCERRAREWS